MKVLQNSSNSGFDQSPFPPWSLEVLKWFLQLWEEFSMLL